jgi:leader peptidase (prepilin peptidase)/N-methyltransferase
MEVVLGLWIVLFGLVLGSFFNVVIYRLPRKLSLVKPGSSCPQCGHRLGPGELVPVLRGC